MKLFLLYRLLGLAVILEGFLIFIGIRSELGLDVAKMIGRERHKRSL